MLFNSFSFLLFLPVVFIFYWFVTPKSLKGQNLLLLTSSYFFYACWDYRFLFLLMFSTSLDYFTGIKIAEAKTLFAKKCWFWLSITINLGFLCLFKYYNFFAESFAEAVSLIGFTVNPLTIKVILPIGISFYTFHGLSYIIDIYNKRIKPEKDILNYSLFVSFFPLLVAGPIERATHLLPQLQNKRSFNSEQAIDGLRQMLWGFFKKIVIADQCAQYANGIFNASADYSGSTNLIGALLFTFQIYCDFSGYSDIAIGTAKLFGINLLRNFAFPYFSRDIAEFWRRWHISLSSWFKDYLYIPLGGSKNGIGPAVRNTFLIFLVSGFWHGANWTFIVWGLLNALYFLPLLLLQKNRSNLEIVAKGRLFPSFKELLSICVTFSMTVFAWIFFRAENLHHAKVFISKIFSPSLFTKPGGSAFSVYGAFAPVTLVFVILFFIIIEWTGREKEHPLAGFGIKWPRIIRLAFYNMLVFTILIMSGKEQQFIYFQF